MIAHKAVAEDGGRRLDVVVYIAIITAVCRSFGLAASVVVFSVVSGTEVSYWCKWK